MKATGIVRRIDDLGRVVIPKEIRRTLRIREGDPLEIFVDHDGEVILKKYSPLSNMDGFAEDVCSALSRQSGKSVFICDKDVFVAVSGLVAREILGQAISKKLLELAVNRQTLLCAYSDGGTPIRLTETDDFGFCNQLVMPIRVNDEGVGCIVLCDKSKENEISSSDIELTELACEVLAGRFR